jgi:tetratricopeptide (TPR) repeat protein
MNQPANSPAWQAAADQWGINVLLILESRNRAADRQDTLDFCQSSNWHPVYMDEVSLVLLRNVPANQPWLDHLQIDCRTQQLVPPASASRKALYDFFASAGDLLFALRRDRESEAALQRAVALYPNDPNVRMTLARLYHRHGMLDKAEAEYRTILTLNETDQPWDELGRIDVERNHFPEAEQAFSRAAHLAATPCTSYMNLAQVELWLNHPSAALQAYTGAEDSSPYRKGAESLAPGLYADIADGRAEAERMLSHRSLAIEFEQEAVRLDPSVVNRWNKLADLYESAGQSDSSQQARERARQLEHNAGSR